MRPAVDEHVVRNLEILHTQAVDYLGVEGPDGVSRENHIAVMGLVGAGLILVGLSVLLFFPAKYAASGLIRLSAMIIKGIKSLFIGKSPRVQEVVK